MTPQIVGGQSVGSLSYAYLQPGHPAYGCQVGARMSRNSLTRSLAAQPSSEFRPGVYRLTEGQRSTYKCAGCHKVVGSLAKAKARRIRSRPSLMLPDSGHREQPCSLRHDASSASTAACGARRQLTAIWGMRQRSDEPDLWQGPDQVHYRY